MEGQCEHKHAWAPIHFVKEKKEERKNGYARPHAAPCVLSALSLLIVIAQHSSFDRRRSAKWYTERDRVVALLGGVFLEAGVRQ